MRVSIFRSAIDVLMPLPLIFLAAPASAGDRVGAHGSSASVQIQLTAVVQPFCKARNAAQRPITISGITDDGRTVELKLSDANSVQVDCNTPYSYGLQRVAPVVHTEGPLRSVQKSNRNVQVAAANTAVASDVLADVDMHVQVAEGRSGSQSAGGVRAMCRLTAAGASPDGCTNEGGEDAAGLTAIPMMGSTVFSVAARPAGQALVPVPLADYEAWVMPGEEPQPVLGTMLISTGSIRQMGNGAVAQPQPPHLTLTISGKF